MSYRDHANRHGFGGTDPALFGWEATSGGGGGGPDYQWIRRDTDLVVGTGGFGGMGNYDTQGGKPGTSFAPNPTFGWINILRTGLYAFQGEMDVKPASLPLAPFQFQVSLSVSETTSPGAVHPAQSGGKSSVALMAGPTSMGADALPYAAATIICAITSLAGDPANNFAQLRFGHDSGSSKTVDCWELFALRLGDV